MIVGFIGAGNMAAAMARGWYRTSQAGPDSMLFTDSGSGRARVLAREVNGRAVDRNEELVKSSDIVVLAVKPKDLDRVADSLPAPGMVLSLLGATPLEALQSHFPESTVLRLMPNLGVEVGRGVICVAASPEADRDRVARARQLLESIARVFDVPDERMDAATALMGCTPAYFAVAAEVLIAEAVNDGIEPGVAAGMVSEVLAGTGELLEHRSPFEIQVAVASPGGSTEAGLEALSETGGRDAVKAAYVASMKRMRGE